MGIGVETFIAQYSSRVGGMKGVAEEYLRLLLSFVNQDYIIKDLRQRAYLLATVRHETADTFAPIIERGERNYFDQYEPGTNKGRSLGNLEKGDGYLFRGRGYVQITGRTNYARLSHPDYANRNILTRPDDALIPEVAYRILSTGMGYGLFTGAAIDRYIDADRADYFNARRVINGVDRALKIQGYANLFEEILKRTT